MAGAAGAEGHLGAKGLRSRSLWPPCAMRGEPGGPHILQSPWRARASLRPSEQGVCQELHRLTWRLSSNMSHVNPLARPPTGAPGALEGVPPRCVSGWVTRALGLWPQRKPRQSLACSVRAAGPQGGPGCLGGAAVHAHAAPYSQPPRHLCGPAAWLSRVGVEGEGEPTRALVITLSCRPCAASGARKSSRGHTYLAHAAVPHLRGVQGNCCGAHAVQQQGR